MYATVDTFYKTHMAQSHSIGIACERVRVRFPGWVRRTVLNYHIQIEIGIVLCTAIEAIPDKNFISGFRCSGIKLGFKNIEFLLNLQQFLRSLKPNLFVAKNCPKQSGFKPQKLRNQFFVVFTPRKPTIRGLTNLHILFDGLVIVNMSPNWCRAGLLGRPLLDLTTIFSYQATVMGYN